LPGEVAGELLHRFDAAAFEHEDRVRRLIVFRHQALHRRLLADRRKHHGRDVRFAEHSAAAGDLLHGVAGTEAARHDEIDPFVLVEALGDAGEVRGVFAGRDPAELICHPVDCVRGRAAKRGDGECSKEATQFMRHCDLRIGLRKDVSAFAL
jgi:hypothetical protein